MLPVTTATADCGITTKLKRSDWLQAASITRFQFTRSLCPQNSFIRICNACRRSKLQLESKSEIQFKSCDPDIDKGFGRFHLRFHLSLSAIMPNEVVGSYPEL